MITCIIAEKPSVARDIARIVGANRREDGFLEGADYLVTWAFGHLITLSMPEQYGYGAYKAEELPLFPQPFQLMVRHIALLTRVSRSSAPWMPCGFIFPAFPAHGAPNPQRQRL